MDAAEIAAGILGPLYVVVGIGILADPAQYRRMGEEFLRNPALIYLGGAAAFSTGVIILLFHNEWSADWRVAVTIIGWLACLKGAVLLIAPNASGRLWIPLLQNTGFLRGGGIGAIALGIFFSLAAYRGF